MAEMEKQPEQQGVNKRLMFRRKGS